MIPDLSRTSPQASAEQIARSIEQARLLSTLRALGPVSGAPVQHGGADAADAFRLRLIEALGQYAEAVKQAATGATPAEVGLASGVPGPAALQPSFGAPDPVVPQPSAGAAGPAAGQLAPGAPDAAAPQRSTGAPERASGASGARTSAVPGDPEVFIRGVADRHGIDREFLLALRKVENGGPGREFGVLSVPAPTFADQAQVAAETVRRNVQRYEGTGRQAVDPATGRYTEGFIRFFSGRYAPIGAENDPKNLNAHHARNLIQRYTDMARQG